MLGKGPAGSLVDGVENVWAKDVALAEQPRDESVAPSDVLAAGLGLGVDSVRQVTSLSRVALG